MEAPLLALSSDHGKHHHIYYNIGIHIRSLGVWYYKRDVVSRDENQTRASASFSFLQKDVRNLLWGQKLNDAAE